MGPGLMENDYHRICGRRWGCMDIYKQIGYSKGPSVFLKVIVAFLIPVLIFIVSVILAQKILTYWVNSPSLKMLLAFLISVLLTLVYILVVKLVTSQPVDSQQNK
jgi:hypothetical protein